MYSCLDILEVSELLLGFQFKKVDYLTIFCSHQSFGQDSSGFEGFWWPQSLSACFLNQADSHQKKEIKITWR
jgi:hypothetical protein